jgi:hypothetical protein
LRLFRIAPPGARLTSDVIDARAAGERLAAVTGFFDA